MEALAVGPAYNLHLCHGATLFTQPFVPAFGVADTNSLIGSA